MTGFFFLSLFLYFQDQYISLLLQDGRVQFRVGYGGESILSLTTKERYNTGNWTTIQATRFYNSGSRDHRGPEQGNSLFNLGSSICRIHF